MEFLTKIGRRTTILISRDQRYLLRYTIFMDYIMLFYCSCGSSNPFSLSLWQLVGKAHRYPDFHHCLLILISSNHLEDWN